MSIEIGDLTDEYIQKTIDTLRLQRADYIEENKAAENTDKVVIDSVCMIDGTEFAGGKADNYSFVLGQNIMLPEFEAVILGMKTGESKDVEVSFSEDYQVENLKGKKAVFKITLKTVSKQQLPELNEEFLLDFLAFLMANKKH